MKKLFLVELIALILFCSCASINTPKEDQIVKTSIDLAKSYVQLKEFDKAEDVYKQALNEVSDYRLWYNLSIVQYEKNELDDAIQSLNRAISKNKNNQSFLNTKVMYLEKAERYDEAIEILEKLNKTAKDKTQNQKKIITLLMNSGKNDQAYQMALDLWNKGTKDSFISDVLYKIGGDEWEIVNKVLSR